MDDWLRRVLGGKPPATPKTRMTRIVVTSKTSIPNCCEALVPDVLSDDLKKALTEAGIRFVCIFSTSLEGDLEAEYAFRFAPADAGEVQRICDLFKAPEWYEGAPFWRPCGQPLERVEGSLNLLWCPDNHTFRHKPVGWVAYLYELGHRGLRQHRWELPHTCPLRIPIDPNADPNK